MRNQAFAVLLVMAAGSAQAQIYKCPQGGKIVYSDKPCSNAAQIDITNASTPSKADYYSARARALREQASINQKNADDAREASERKNCQRIIRDHNWTVNTAAKYKADEWWRNEGFDSEENLRKRCGKYLIPAGAK